MTFSPSKPIPGKKFIGAVGAESVVGTAVTPTIRLDLISESLKAVASHDNTERLRGSVQPGADSVIKTRENVSGDLVMAVRPPELAVIAPAIMGGALDSNYYPFAEAAPTFTAEIDRVAKVYTYAGLHVNTAQFAAQSGQLLKSTISVLGMSCVETAAGSGTDLDFGQVAPFIMSNLVLLLDGNATECEDFQLTIDRQLDAEHFANSLTRTTAATLGFAPTGTVTIDYNTDNVALRAKMLSKAVASLKATFTSGSNIFEIECPKVVFTGEETVGDGADARKMQIPFAAVRTEGATPVDCLKFKLIVA